MSLNNGKVAIDGSHALEETAPIAAMITPTKGIVEKSAPSKASQEGGKTTRVITNNRALIAICLLLLLIGIIILIVVLVVVVNDNDAKTAGYRCSATNTAAPTLDDGYRLFCDDDHTFCWNQVGSDIMGKSREDRLAAPVSLSEDGSRFAATFWGPLASQGWPTGYPFIRVYEIIDGTQFRLVGQELNATTANAELGFWAEGHLTKNGKRLAAVEGAEGHEPGLHPVTMYELSPDASDNNICQWVSLPTGNVLLLGRENNPLVSMNYDGSIVALASTALQYEEAGWDWGSIECHIETFRYNGKGIGWERLGSALTFQYGGCKSELSSDGSILGIMTDRVSIFHLVNGDWKGGHVPTQIDRFQGEERFDFLFSMSSTGKHFAIFAQSIGIDDFRRSNDIFLYSYNENQKLWSQANVERKLLTGGVNDADLPKSNFDFVGKILLSDSGKRIVEDRVVVRSDVVHHELRIHDMVEKTWKVGGTIISEKYYSNDLSDLSVDLSGDGRRILVGQWGRNMPARIQMYECEYHGVRCDKA